MNTFNRIVLVVLVLVAMVLCSLTLVVPLATLQTVARGAEELAEVLTRIRAVVRLPAGILLALIVNLIGILFIVLEVRRPAAKAIRVEQTTGGHVTLSVASIADQVKAELGQLPEILQVKPKVSSGRKGVLVEVDARIAAEERVPDKADRIVAAIERVVEEKMGLKMARPPKVNIEAVRAGSGTSRAREAASAGVSPGPADVSGPQNTSDDQGDLSS